ncbi:hypothetical protein PHYC_03600 [Phycisphaerales bacterium]|nr:hypothetical protein PHYC_03600 [Phycisphaerales bacterium]
MKNQPTKGRIYRRERRTWSIPVLANKKRPTAAEISASERVVGSFVAAWNEGRDPEMVLSVAERRARRVLEGEGVRPVKDVSNQGTVRSVPTLGTILIDGTLSERAEVAISVLWSAFMAREAMKAGDLAKSVVEAIAVGTLSERMLVLPFEAEVVRLASNRSKGAEKTRAKFAARRMEWARRVEALCPDGKGVTKACIDVAEWWIQQQGLKNPNRESLRESIRSAYRTVFPAKPRD